MDNLSRPSSSFTLMNMIAGVPKDLDCLWPYVLRRIILKLLAAKLLVYDLNVAPFGKNPSSFISMERKDLLRYVLWKTSVFLCQVRRAQHFRRLAKMRNPVLGIWNSVFLTLQRFNGPQKTLFVVDLVLKRSRSKNGGPQNLFHCDSRKGRARP